MTLHCPNKNERIFCIFPAQIVIIVTGVLPQSASSHYHQLPVILLLYVYLSHFINMIMSLVGAPTGTEHELAAIREWANLRGIPARIWTWRGDQALET